MRNLGATYILILVPLLDLEVGQLGSDPARSVSMLLSLGSASGTLFSAINKMELEPAVVLVMRSC